MSDTADPQARDPGTAALVARWTQWLGEVEQALQQEGQALERERESLRGQLKDLGLETPEAIQAAYRDMDASEREALARQVRGHRPAATASSTADPSNARGRARRRFI